MCHVVFDRAVGKNKQKALTLLRCQKVCKKLFCFLVSRQTRKTSTQLGRKCSSNPLTNGTRICKNQWTWSLVSSLTLSQVRGGGGRGWLLLKYVKNVLHYELETFWKFKWINFQNKHFFSKPPPPTFVTIATSKGDACFWRDISAVFMQNLTRTRRVFAIPMQSVLKGHLRAPPFW